MSENKQVCDKHNKNHPCLECLRETLIKAYRRDGVYPIGTRPAKAERRVGKMTPPTLKGLKEAYNRLTAWADSERIWAARLPDLEAVASLNRARNYDALAQMIDTAIKEASPPMESENTGEEIKRQVEG